jgi:hypothetical protein
MLVRGFEQMELARNTGGVDIVAAESDELRHDVDTDQPATGRGCVSDVGSDSTDTATIVADRDWPVLRQAALSQGCQRQATYNRGISTTNAIIKIRPVGQRCVVGLKRFA